MKMLGFRSWKAVIRHCRSCVLADRLQCKLKFPLLVVKGRCFMGWFRRKKEDFIKSYTRLLQQVFFHTKGSWGPILIDENGNIVDEAD